MREDEEEWNKSGGTMMRSKRGVEVDDVS